MMENQGSNAPADPYVLAAAASGVRNLIAAKGGDVDRIFGHAQIDTSKLESPFNELSLRQYCCLFEEAARQTHYDNFGLRFGEGFLPKQLGALGYLAINSPTMAAAVRNLSSYFSAHQQNSTLAIRQERDLLKLDYQITDGRIVGRRQDAELSLGMFRNIFRQCHGERWCPVEIHFEHPQPMDGDEHETVFQAPVYFAQQTNSLVFRRDDLDAVMPGHDPYLFALIEPFMRGRQTRQGRQDDLIGLVQHQIEAQFCDGNPQLGKVAAGLGMTSWTLQRRLKSLNVSFHDLVQASRRDLALRYVAEPHIPLTEVAFLLGYSELSAFSRAFRQWTGMAPARYRRRHGRH
ncbi:MAG: AraC family transcriptional regulator [Gammaproteobacteria bacterium]|nr:AraC family transcriptional regulator [Gammaproteobacteria bacterium]